MTRNIITLLVMMAAGLGLAVGQESFVAVGGNDKAQISVDSAAIVVDNYMGLLNYEALAIDSIFYMETVIYKRSRPDDTAIMKRWFLQPNLFRVELWHGDTLLEGCFSDGKEIFREYRRGVLDGWTRVADSRYHNIMPGYDFRGALHYWRADGTSLRYDGVWDYNGHDVYKIYAESPEKYNRYYYFEKESGLLFMIEETGSHSEYSNHQAFDHPDFHAYHEYQPFGDVIIPSVESYQMNGDVLFYYSKFRNIGKELKLFREN